MGVVIHGYGALFDVGMEVVRGMHASQNGGGGSWLVACRMMPENFPSAR